MYFLNNDMSKLLISKSGAYQNTAYLIVGMPKMLYILFSERSKMLHVYILNVETPKMLYMYYIGSSYIIHSVGDKLLRRSYR